MNSWREHSNTLFLTFVKTFWTIFARLFTLSFILGYFSEFPMATSKNAIISGIIALIAGIYECKKQVKALCSEEIPQ
ncbi:MAG: hypothetical protein Q4D77_00645 [Peptostreptococcaceae bacterium]|nr:hypothetical protein [Peptostreptococcaceae bacterium]